MKELTRVERAAVAAHARGDDWTQFWDTHRHAIALAEPWDRQRFHRLVRQLTSLVVAGNADGERPLDNPLCPWDEADTEAAPILLVDDTTTSARCLWSPGQEAGSE